VVRSIYLALRRSTCSAAIGQAKLLHVPAETLQNGPAREDIPHSRRTLLPSLPLCGPQLDQQPWRRVNGTIGVSSLVMQGEQPQPVPRGVVEALAACADPNGILQLQAHLKVGNPVRLVAGPFAEQLAMLDELDGAGRVRVLLNILGRRVSISMDGSNLLPIHPV
jgi:transcription antitermination factor NusG